MCILIFNCELCGLSFEKWHEGSVISAQMIVKKKTVIASLMLTDISGAISPLSCDLWRRKSQKIILAAVADPQFHVNCHFTTLSHFYI